MNHVAIVVSQNLHFHMPVIAGLASYPDQIVEKMETMGVRVDAMDCLTLAQQAGSVKAVNLVLMGRLSRFFPQIPNQAWMEALEAVVPLKLQEINQRAFALGRGEEL